jgi:ABC-type uncharacterized transport system involved in gliding motility auxiliary subunit
MRNALCIMRRDLGAYFTSPIGYIFIMVFVTISVGLYMTSFFMFPVADMRPYFDNLPLLLCVFVPAVTMRVWAEERKENTWEMLLTFPMQAWELTIGKFLAAAVFFALTLFATITVPMMLFSLGNPDTGAVFGGYLGTYLLGLFFLSLGIFYSGFFKDQIVAFVVTLLTCFAFFLLGTEFIASYIDGRVPGLGTLLTDVMGLFNHFTPFSKGVIDLADVTFFLVWTVLFLSLNVLYIDGRNRPGAKTIFLTAVGLSVAIGLVFNWMMAGTSVARFDLTEDKIYTVSDASGELLASLDVPAQVNVYITPREDMPTGLKDLERDITDKLEELRIAAGGNLEYNTVYLAAPNLIKDTTAAEDADAEKPDDEKAIETRMLDKGIEPFNVQAMSQDEVTAKLIYSSIGVAYKDKTEEIVPQILPQSLDQLEYRIVSTVYKLTREKKPIVALVAPKEAVKIDPQMRQILMQMGQPIPQSDDPYVYLEQILNVEKYDVRRVELTKESPLPEEYDTLAVINPRDLNDRQRWEISRALQAGKSVVMAVQTYEWEYRPTRQGNNISQRKEEPGVNALLEKYGLGVSESVLMDVNKVPMTVQTGTMQDLMGGGQTVNLPIQILVNNSTMNQDTALTNRLASIFYLWGTALEFDQEKLKTAGLNAEVLMTSSPQAWTVEAGAELTGKSFEFPGTGEAYPLMAQITGQFPDAFAGQERPAWPKPEQQPGQPPLPDMDEEEPAATPVEAKPGQLILLGCAEMFRKNFLQGGNLDLFLNSVDAVSLDPNLVKVRGQKPTDRSITTPTDRQKTIWRLANYGLANLVIAGIGIGYTLMRRRARNSYTVAHYND